MFPIKRMGPTKISRLKSGADDQHHVEVSLARTAPLNKQVGKTGKMKERLKTTTRKSLMTIVLYS